jgi:hypothetical protein
MPFRIRLFPPYTVTVSANGGNFRGRVGGNIGGPIIDRRKPETSDNSCPALNAAWNIRGANPGHCGENSTLVRWNRLLFKEYEYLPTKILAQLVEGLRYKPEVRRFDSRWCYWKFSLT